MPDGLRWWCPQPLLETGQPRPPDTRLQSLREHCSAIDEGGQRRSGNFIDGGLLFFSRTHPKLAC